MTLPANSTFLPVLDDLLSPDLRPVLQTPTTENGGMTGRTYGVSGFANVIATHSDASNNIGRGQMTPVKKINFKTKPSSRILPEEDRASRKIQHWWKAKSQRRHSGDLDIRAERAKHAIRHNRTEDHVLYLESEVSRLKSALSAERKARSLQMDAIRCLWSQVQQMSSSGAESIMTQSMPNGLLTSTPKRGGANGQGDSQSQMSMSYAGGGFQPDTCTANCSKEIQLLRESMSTEIAQLREMLASLHMGQGQVQPSAHEPPRDSMEVDNEEDPAREAGTVQPPQRPYSLNIMGMSTSSSSQVDSMETPEISEYAGVMARNLLEKAVESEEEARNRTIPVKELS